MFKGEEGRENVAIKRHRTEGYEEDIVHSMIYIPCVIAVWITLLVLNSEGNDVR